MENLSGSIIIIEYVSYSLFSGKANLEMYFWHSICNNTIAIEFWTGLDEGADKMPHFSFEPKKELEDLSARMKKFVEELPESFAVEFGSGFSPRVDVTHDQENVYVYMELPGVLKENISLKIKENTLLISGTKEMPDTENHKVTLTERMNGSFEREIPLPEKVDHASINASFELGILRVQLKKVVPDAAKEVNIDIN
jgi:HSP20 family protein